MANLLKKKFIGNDQVDGSKILLENDQFFRVKLADGSAKNLLKLDSTDKFILTDAPIITTPSTDANAVQTKTQMDAAVSAEAALRASADSALQGEVDAVETGLSQEIIDRGAADTALQGNIDTEITNRTNADTALGGRIDTEISDRQAADALLIPLSQKGSANGVAPLNAQGLIESQYLPSYVDDVIEGADLASFPVTGETGKMYVALDSGKVYRWSGSIYVEISSNEVNSVFGRVGVVTAQVGDYTTAQVTEDPSALYFTDARAQAANDARFDLVEADVADHETRIVSAEASIVDHETRIDALEDAVPAWSKGKKALIADDITAGYIDLAHEVVPGSLSVFVDRLSIHEGAAEDYTLSVVGGVTRVTFVNSMIAPGSEALSAGDNIYYKYQF